MAHYDKQSGLILLSVDDQEVFNECNHKIQTHNYPISKSIMRSILKDTGVESDEIPNF